VERAGTQAHGHANAMEEFAILFVASLHDRTFLEELFFVIWFA
jgi:hypothetical protein